MKRGSVSRPSSRAAGQGAEPGPVHPKISAGPQHGSSVPSVPLRAKALVSSCPAATARPRDVNGSMHLEDIAFHVAPGAHAVLILDQAGWHGSAELVVPANITLMPLPPRCPELNPVENVWQFMRDNWLSNRIFSSYDDIVDHCCFAWNKLVDQPWRIMSIGLRQWAHGY